MRRTLIAIDLSVLNDDRLTDAEYRLLARMSANFGTKMFNADEQTFCKLQTSRRTFYRLCDNLIKCQYLQHDQGNSQYSVSVPILALKSAKDDTDSANNGTDECQNCHSEEKEETEEKRTKREEKEDKEEYIYNNTLSESLSKVTEREEKENTIVQPDSEEKIQEKEKRKRRVFVKPTLEEIQAYCKERESTVSATAFYDWYESNGWMVGRHHMVDWKASVRTWEQKDRAAGRYIVPPENRSNEKKEAMSEVCPF